MTVLLHVTVKYKGESVLNAEEEYFYCDEELHREDGPAVTKRQYFALGTTEHYYYRRGKLDRTDGPAVVKRDFDGSTEEKYYREGRLREDGPAIVQKDAYGTTTREEYYLDGKLGRNKGPAVICRGSDGSTREEYHRYGLLYREDGPAIVEWNPWDQSTTEHYYVNGQERSDGPAIIRRNSDGSTEERYLHHAWMRDLKDGPGVIKRNADGSTVQEYYQSGKLTKIDYLNKDGVVVKTSNGEAEELARKQAALDGVVKADRESLKRIENLPKTYNGQIDRQPTSPPDSSGPNRYAELKKATPLAAPRAPQKSRAPAPA